MKLNDFQQRVLDTCDDYLNELTASRANFLKTAALKVDSTMRSCRTVKVRP